MFTSSRETLYRRVRKSYRASIDRVCNCQVGRQISTKSNEFVQMMVGVEVGDYRRFNACEHVQPFAVQVRGKEARCRAFAEFADVEISRDDRQLIAYLAELMSMRLRIKQTLYCKFKLISCVVHIRVTDVSTNA